MENRIFRILAVGDVVGKHGTECIRRFLPSLSKELRADFVVVNGENSAVGNGITPESAETLRYAGADVVTGGNHSFRRREIYDYLDDTPSVLRPADYPSAAPGFGSCIVRAGGLSVLVMNLLGTVYMESLENPFETAERILTREIGKYDLAICDFHGEATSEKKAFAHHFDGRFAVVFGTHTHVQTNDPTILPKGTGYVTDLGMTGIEDSVLGVKKEVVIRKFLTKMPTRFEEADGDEVLLCGALFEYDRDAKKTVNVSLVRKNYRLKGQGNGKGNGNVT